MGCIGRGYTCLAAARDTFTKFGKGSMILLQLKSVTEFLFAPMMQDQGHTECTCRRDSPRNQTVVGSSSSLGLLYPDCGCFAARIVPIRSM